VSNSHIVDRGGSCVQLRPTQSHVGEPNFAPVLASASGDPLVKPNRCRPRAVISAVLLRLVDAAAYPCPTQARRASERKSLGLPRLRVGLVWANEKPAVSFLAVPLLRMHTELRYGPRGEAADEAIDVAEVLAQLFGVPGVLFAAEDRIGRFEEMAAAAFIKQLH